MASVVVSLLHSLRFLVRSRASLHLEIIALRHQLAVVNRSRRPRLRFTAADRRLWVWLSRSWRGWRSAVHIVKPETVIAWHRRGFRLFWTWKSGHRIGRPAVPADVRALIREMSTTNPLWGAPRIHGELLKLGIAVSQSTVAKYMRRHPRPPSQTWRTFLRNHASQILAADLFVVPTITFRLLFVLIILAHDRRRIVHVAVTEHPTAAWTAQQLRNAFSEHDVHAVIDNFSRRILAWRVAETLAPVNSVAVLVEASRGATPSATTPVVLADAGVENMNADVDDLITAGVLRRVLAFTELKFSNSMIEAWWRVLKHHWLFLHSLDSVTTVRRLVEFYVQEHNRVLPHSAFRGQTPDEMYFGTGKAVPADLTARAATARQLRVEANRSAACGTCPSTEAAA